MAIETQDSLYTANIVKWQLVRDAVEGERAIKARGTRYLREFYPDMARNDVQKWGQFLNLTAEFPNVSARIHTAMSGAMLRTLPSLQAPEESIDFIENSFGTTNSGYLSLVADIIAEELITARTGILVDRDASGEGDPYPRVYPAEHILGTVESTINGKPVFTNVRLLESRERLSESYEVEVYNQVRELGIDEDGNYYQRLWESGKKIANPHSEGQSGINAADGGFEIVVQEGADEFGRIYPRLNNQPFDYIPFWLANGCTEECKPPLFDIAQQNIHLYNKVSYDNWAFYVYNTVTQFVAGVSEDEASTFSLGGIWAASNPDAKISPVSGQADVMREGRAKIEQSYETISALGASMFGQQGGSGDSAAALKIRNAPNGAIVGMIAMAVSETLTQVLQFAEMWRSGSREVNTDIQIQVHNNINPNNVEPAELTAVVGSVAQGLVPVEVLFYALEKADLLPPGFDPVLAAEQAASQEPVVPDVN